MTVEVKLEGLDQLKRKFKALPQRAGINAMRRALRRGANVVRDKARAKAARVDDPATREQIAKNIVVQGGGSKRERQSGGPMMRIGVMGGAKNYKGNRANTRSGRAGKSYSVGGSSSNPGGDTWYWRLLELGTSKMAARPFLRPAASEAAASAFSEIVKAMNVELDKEIKKL